MDYMKYKWHRNAASDKSYYYPQRRWSQPDISGGRPFPWYSPIASKENDERAGTQYHNKSEWNGAHPDTGSTPSQWNRRTWADEPAADYGETRNDKKDDGTDQSAAQSWTDASDGVSGGRDQCGSRSTEIRSDSTRSQHGDSDSRQSYPRFATYTRQSTRKHTFVHFSETKYDTRQSVDDTNIVYREYAQDAIPRSPRTDDASTDTSRSDTKTSGPLTLMICNIPCRFTQQELMTMLNAKGFANTYNFFYLPMDGKRASKPHAVKKASNLGYAFVNFHTSQDAARFHSTFHGFCFVGYDGTLSKKVCKVAPARMQGFYENLRCYQRRITCDEITRNSPFIDVPLKHFNMKTSKFIEWIFSPTDIAQFLPACKEASWAGDTITCDDILPYSIVDQNELRYRKDGFEHLRDPCGVKIPV